MPRARGSERRRSRRGLGARSREGCAELARETAAKSQIALIHHHTPPNNLDEHLIAHTLHPILPARAHHAMSLIPPPPSSLPARQSSRRTSQVRLLARAALSSPSFPLDIWTGHRTDLSDRDASGVVDLAMCEDGESLERWSPPNRGDEQSKSGSSSVVPPNTLLLASFQLEHTPSTHHQTLPTDTRLPLSSSPLSYLPNLARLAVARAPCQPPPSPHTTQQPSPPPPAPHLLFSRRCRRPRCPRPSMKLTSSTLQHQVSDMSL